jgi:hypothetical protein
LQSCPKPTPDLYVYRADTEPVTYSVANDEGKTVTFDVVSRYDAPLEGDIVFVLAQSEVPEFSTWTLIGIVVAVTLVAALAKWSKFGRLECIQKKIK